MSQNNSHRERKKMQLRENLVEAAYNLFVKKGFNNTTIKDIANSVNVSPRTFFRYFPSKEDVVLDYKVVEYDEIISALACRPVNEPILTALRKASVSVTKACEEGEYGIDPTRFRTLRDLIRNHPLIQAKNLELLHSKREELILLISKKIDVPANIKISRATTIAMLLDFVYSTAYDTWKEYEVNTTYYEVLDDVFSMLENGFNYSCIE